MALVHLDLKPASRTLRQFGLIGLVVFPIFAVLAYYQVLAFKFLPDVAVKPTAIVLAALAVYCGLFALIAPAALKPLYVLMAVVFFPIGLVVSFLVMAVVFYLVLTPMGLVFKLIGRDSMNRKFEPAMPSYWIKRCPPASVKRYFRQF